MIRYQTLPEMLDKESLEGCSVWFTTTVDDYGEVWVNGQMPVTSPIAHRRSATRSCSSTGTPRGFGPIPMIDIPLITERATVCCSPDKPVLVDTSGVTEIPAWIEGTVSTSVGTVPRVSTTLSRSDRIGSWKARWNVNRMNYQVPPGLYAVGAPDENSVVLVSANYKMSFDRLRSRLGNVDAWIMVLDTKGINVWCAAGKGTFGTDEIVNRVRAVQLDTIVKHRTLILPQLGAPGVAGYEVQRQTAFRVLYGPVRAEDIPAFLAAGNKATKEMRRVRFGWKDRVVLTPLELVGAIKPSVALLALLFLISLALDLWAPFLVLLARTGMAFLPFLGAVIIGAVLTPTLLPYIPGRAFALKGWLLAFVLTLAFVLYPGMPVSWTARVFYLLVLPAVSSFLAMNFTGASTYTSLSGVVREMKVAVPTQITLAGLGVLFVIVAAVVGV